MKIYNDYEVPAGAARQGKGSKYFTAETQETVDKLEVGQTLIIPFVDAAKAIGQRSQVAWYLNKHTKGQGKTFVVFVTADKAAEKGIGIKLLSYAKPAELEQEIAA